MARIGDYELRNIRNRILDDLYLKREEEFKVRQTAIVKQSRELYLKPYQYLIDQLPVEMVSHDTEYKLKIKYTPNKDKSDISVDEIWNYKVDTAIINPVNSSSRGSYNHTPENMPDESLWDVTEELCKDMLALKAERDEQSHYLLQITKMYTGSVQLRKALPESLHKYLPNEPAKPERKVKNILTGKIEKIADPVVPASLKTRMTTNLLEDN